MAKAEILLETGTNELEILELFIAERVQGREDPVRGHFGINVAKVMQVIECPELSSPESRSNPSFMGTISLRDLIIPVLDLAIWLGMDRVPGPEDVIVVTEFSQTVTGFLVSGVTDIHRVGWGEVEPPSTYVSRLGSNALIGTVTASDHFIQLLDMESILAGIDPVSLSRIADAMQRSDIRRRALLADDSATIRELLRENLEQANFDLTIVNNGEEAVRHLQKLKDRALSEGRSMNELLDIVIADIEMPRMDGFSLTKTIKEDPQLGTLPVILYSSLITRELRHKGEAVGADDQITKPEMDKMAERALKLISGRG